MKKLKRYQWFGYTQYYPGGGSSDIEGEGETLEELREAIQARKDRWKNSDLPDENEVMDLQERAWLSKDAVLSLGLIPSDYIE